MSKTEVKAEIDWLHEQDYGALYYRLYSQVRKRLNALSDDDLRRVERATGLLTKTNCGWTTYELRNPLATEASVILRIRERERTAKG